MAKKLSTDDDWQNIEFERRQFMIARQDTWNYEKERDYELWCLEHKPWIFNRVVWTHTIGNPADKYDTCYVFEKIQLSYLSKLIRAIQKFFLGEFNYIIYQARRSSLTGFLED